MSPVEKGQLRADNIPSVADSEARIAQDAPALKAKVEKTDWPADKKASFLDAVLGKKP